MAVAVTKDAIIGGRVWLYQLGSGHRVGTDSVLVAAFCRALAGQRLVDLGAGVGAVGLCVQARVGLGELYGIELEPTLAALARDNMALNGMDAAKVLEADLCAPFRALSKAGVPRDHFDHVAMNPPFHDETSNLASPDGRRRKAHMGDAPLLEQWLKNAATLLHAKGEVCLIHRADRLAMILSMMGNWFGALRVVPVMPKASGAALRVLVSGRKGSRAPLQLLTPLIMADAAGRPTAEAEHILRDGAGLER